MTNYTMSCYKLAASVVEKIASRQFQFWWEKETRKFLHTISWSRVCQSKPMGGLGIIDLN